ncbi:MAG: hypothetical protein D6782_13660 [Alphaproteobacteria bacterium]|nr:MAG: hypothetical protein D6782_13660 [Alphaproteobacteria bacterium]
MSLDAVMQAIALNGVAVEANQRAFTLGRWAVYDGERVDKMLAAVGGAGADAPPPARLDALIAHREALLTAYQDCRYASRYRALVERVRAREALCGQTSEALARTVAHNAAKLMAYKDEYEVARLYTDGDFAQALARTFAGKPKPYFHLAPPLLARRDPDTGLPRKRMFGPWLWPVLKGLARLKGLRGTWADVFGYQAERRLERQLIADYFALVEELCAKLGPANHGLALKLAALPERVRGFGHIKARQVAEMRAQQARLLANFRSASTAGDSARPAA